MKQVGYRSLLHTNVSGLVRMNIHSHCLERSIYNVAIQRIKFFCAISSGAASQIKKHSCSRFSVTKETVNCRKCYLSKFEAFSNPHPTPPPSPTPTTRCLSCNAHVTRIKEIQGNTYIKIT